MSAIPYPGLRPFKREEADIFFGREEHTDQLLEKLSHTRFISVVGLSGCGKSSLVRAGMLAALETGYLSKAGSRWQVAAMRPGNQPVYNLANALLEKADVSRETPDAEQLTYLMASHGPLGLVEVLREIPLPGRTNLLLLIDQFEEIFRYYREENLDEAEAFVDLLLTSAEQREVPIYVVITMRSDFIGNCALFRDLPEMINRGQFLVPRLTRDQQRMAIVGPAKVFGGDIEPRLINRLLNEMGYDPDQLPLLQHCLMRMWFRAGARVEGQNQNARNGVMMTLDDYEAAGGLKDALSNHAEEAFAELDQKGQQIAEIMFRCLSERGADRRDTRRPAQVDEIAAVAEVPVADVIQVVEVFRHPERCFLTPPAGVPLEPGSVLDISHESLIRQWQRMQAWVTREAESAEIYQRLEHTASLWKQGKEDLLSRLALENTLDWKRRENPTARWANRYSISPPFVKDAPDTISPPFVKGGQGGVNLAVEFLEASARAQEEHERQRKKEEQRRIEEREHQQQLKLKYARRQLVVVIMGLVIAIVFAGLAFVQWQEAVKAQQQAEEAKQVTEEALETIKAAKAIIEEEKKRVQQALATAEEQKERALAAEQEAKDTKEEAELQKSRFQEMVIATFGFLSESDKNEEFFDWVQETFTMKRFIPVLSMMVDSFENFNTDLKNEWKLDLPTMTQTETITLLNILGIEAAGKAKSTVGIQQVEITDADDNSVSLIGGTCFLRRDQQVRFHVNVNNPFNWELEIHYAAEQGTIRTEDALYMTPDISESFDFVTIAVVDTNLNKTIAYDSIVIQIIE